MELDKLPAWQVCRKSTAQAIHSRRCFATGEYCSKQAKIHRERAKLHNEEKGRDKTSINAFVVMNFSDMSDVAYNWRIQSFIESLKKYLWINPECSEIACVGEALEQEEEQSRDAPAVSCLFVPGKEGTES